MAKNGLDAFGRTGRNMAGRLFSGDETLAVGVEPQQPRTCLADLLKQCRILCYRYAQFACSLLFLKLRSEGWLR